MYILFVFKKYMHLSFFIEKPKVFAAIIATYFLLFEHMTSEKGETKKYEGRVSLGWIEDEKDVVYNEVTGCLVNNEGVVLIGNTDPVDKDYIPKADEDRDTDSSTAQKCNDEFRKYTAGMSNKEAIAWVCDDCPMDIAAWRKARLESWIKNTTDIYTRDQEIEKEEKKVKPRRKK